MEAGAGTFAGLCWIGILTALYFIHYIYTTWQERKQHKLIASREYAFYK